MNNLVGWLVLAVVVVCVLTAAGPTLVALANAAVPLLIVIGCFAIAWRLTWYFTNRY